MSNKESFNTAAKLYDEVRPTYPKEVIDFIIQNTKISKTSNLLEIAPGTGQATMRFGERGYFIDAVELGDKLAEICLDNCKDMNVQVDVSPFETWEPLNNKTYDMIYCATAFHWLDKEIKYQKTYDLLKQNGFLVLLWNHAVGTNNDIINEAYRLLFSYYDNKPFSTKPKSNEEINQQLQDSIKTIEESKHYKVTNHLAYKWTNIQNKRKTIKGFYSQSSYLSLQEDLKQELTDKLETLFTSLEDEIPTEFMTTVYICKPIKD